MAEYIKRELKPFGVPNYVTEGSSVDNEGRPYPCSDVDDETLLRMCNEYTKTVFKRAGKTPPFSLSL